MGTSFLTISFLALRPSIPAWDNPFSPSAENQPFAVSFERKVFIFTHMHKYTMYLYHDNKHQLILLTACFERITNGFDMATTVQYCAEQSIVIFESEIKCIILY